MNDLHKRKIISLIMNMVFFNFRKEYFCWLSVLKRKIMEYLKRKIFVTNPSLNSEDFKMQKYLKFKTFHDLILVFIKQNYTM